MALTTSQKAAVVYDGDLIIFAGPGSGKTSTSVEKAARVLQRSDTKLGMITFTTAAAAEMRERMARRLAASGHQAATARLLVGTFNAITLRHYQRHSAHPKKLLAPPARAALLAGMLRDADPELREKSMQALERYQASLQPNIADVPEECRAFVNNYLKKLESTHAIDLATIMRLCTIEMASGSMPLLNVTHLIGDEMQDADEVQFEFMLVHSLARIPTTLVADDDQTIYEWRNALGYRGLQHFAQEAQAKTIVLAENFRSRSEIVAHATQLIAHNDPNRIAKNQQAIRGAGGTAAAVRFADPKMQCGKLAECIASIAAPGHSIAVLARTNQSLWGMQSALTVLAIPFRKEGTSIWDTPEAVVLLSLLRALVTSKTADLLAVLSASKLERKLVMEMSRVLGPDCGHFLDGDVPGLDGATDVDVKFLVGLTEATRKWRKDMRVGMYDIVIHEARDEVASILVSVGHDASAKQRISKRCSRLFDDCVDLLTKMPGKLSQRLATIQNLEKDAETNPDAVRLMTMHSSKGLEFDTVFLIDADQPEDGLGLDEEAAERRLFYVALTRAKERFVATYSSRFKSQFIDEASLHFGLALGPIFGPNPARSEA